MATTITITTETPESATLIVEILMEVERATKKHPVWPLDIVKRAAIVAEEAGELIREANLIDEGAGSIDNLRKEAIETAATSIRFLRALADDKLMFSAFKEFQGAKKREIIIQH